MTAGICLMALGGAALGHAVLAALPGPSFTLAWTHSIEKTEWREEWRADDAGHLVPVEARVKGTGAGVEPPPHARLSNGWLVWTPDLPPQMEIVLAASSFTGDHTLCAGGQCRPLSGWTGIRSEGPVTIRVCP